MIMTSPACGLMNISPSASEDNQRVGWVPRGAARFFGGSVGPPLVSGQRKAEKKWLHDLFFLLFSQIRDSIVASIPACHAGDRGSIPRDGIGDLAQLVARVLSMHKVAGSIPAGCSPILLTFYHFYKILLHCPGIEPGSQEWESCMIPLHQQCLQVAQPSLFPIPLSSR